MPSKKIRDKKIREMRQTNYQNVVLKREVHTKLKALAKRNRRSMANQIEVWVFAEK